MTTGKTQALTQPQAQLLEMALNEDGIRWGPRASLANVYRRDMALRLERMGMLRRLESRPPPAVRTHWELTDAGRSAVEELRRRRDKTPSSSDNGNAA